MICRSSIVNKPVTGYAEGFYGKLLSWEERGQILDTLQRLQLTVYYYAPKEDPCHRLDWRTPYSVQWREQFRVFCSVAEHRGIEVVAGVAPGLDFNFSHLPGGRDFSTLVEKCQLLLEDGARYISLLMDDIDADFDQRRGSYSREGQAHAALANALGEALDKAQDEARGENHQANKSVAHDSVGSLWVTPRIYADELIPTAPDYLPAFIGTLHQRHSVLYCGSDVVAYSLDESSFDALRLSDPDSIGGDRQKHHAIAWDNLYANDYCPRRLFAGAWQQREGMQDVLLNPTGMVNTDCLLLELMAEGMKLQQQGKTGESLSVEAWRSVLLSHGVPEEFMVLAPFFNHPIFNTGSAVEHCVDSDAVRAAIEHCLWRWKTPLSREWYPALFGLKHDLLALAGEHPDLRIRKTQNAPLAKLLLSDSINRN